MDISNQLELHMNEVILEIISLIMLEVWMSLKTKKQIQTM